MICFFEIIKASNRFINNNQTIVNLHNRNEKLDEFHCRFEGGKTLGDWGITCSFLAKLVSLFAKLVFFLLNVIFFGQRKPKHWTSVFFRWISITPRQISVFFRFLDFFYLPWTSNSVPFTWFGSLADTCVGQWTNARRPMHVQERLTSIRGIKGTSNDPKPPMDK